MFSLNFQFFQIPKNHKYNKNTCLKRHANYSVTFTSQQMQFKVGEKNLSHTISNGKKKKKLLQKTDLILGSNNWEFIDNFPVKTCYFRRICWYCKSLRLFVQTKYLLNMYKTKRVYLQIHVNSLTTSKKS